MLDDEVRALAEGPNFAAFSTLMLDGRTQIQSERVIVKIAPDRQITR